LDTVKVFAPATVANVGCGYDVLGFALEGYGDELTLTRRADDQLVIKAITGASGIPLDPATNVATVSIRALLQELGVSAGFEMTIHKNISPGSGLGSSASSSAAAVFAANELLGRPFTRQQLVPFAMKGEEAASAKPHADNVTPSLLGGFTIVRSYDPLDVFAIPFPSGLQAVIIFPQVEVKTSDAKKILKKQINLSDAVTQWGNVAGLISGLFLSDFDLIGRSLQDVIIEPVRSILIPSYDEAKQLALALGALGYTISGSGPSMFALTQHASVAVAIRDQVSAFYRSRDIEVISFISSINANGTVVIP